MHSSRSSEPSDASRSGASTNLSSPSSPSSPNPSTPAYSPTPPSARTEEDDWRFLARRGLSATWETWADPTDVPVSRSANEDAQQWAVSASEWHLT